MSKEVQENCFEKFYQGDCSRSQEGNGLGLALVKQVVNLLDGKIQVNSFENKGTEFVVVI